MKENKLDRGKFYYGLFVSKEEENKLIDYLKEQNIEIKNLRPSDMHITLAFVSNTEAMNYIDKMIEDGKLTMGNNINIHIESYGEYHDENGRLLNQGLKVRLENPELEKYCNHGIAHLTLSSNPDKGQDGKPLSKPADTYKCIFDKELDYDIIGRAGSYGKNGVVYENVPNMIKIGTMNKHDVYIYAKDIEHPESSHFGTHLAENPQIIQYAAEAMSKDTDFNGQFKFATYQLDYIVGKDGLVETERDQSVRMIRTGRTTISYGTFKRGKDTNCITLGVCKDNDDPIGRDVLFTAFAGLAGEREIGDRNIKAEEEANRVKEFWENHSLSMSVNKVFMEQSNIDFEKTYDLLKKEQTLTSAEKDFVSGYKNIKNVMREVKEDHNLYNLFDYAKVSDKELENYLHYCFIEQHNTFNKKIENLKNSNFPYKELEQKFLDFKTSSQGKDRAIKNIKEYEER